jgi:hypothetical protein
MQSKVVLPPSPNWFSSHLSDLSPGRFFAYCAHNAVVVVGLAGGGASGRVAQVLSGHSNR